MTIASDLFRTITVKINDISQQLPYIVVNQADDNGKIIRFVPLDHGQKVTGFTGARLYYPPRSDNEYGDYVTGVESDGAWDFTIPVGVLSAGRVGCNLAFIDGDGETYSRNVVFLVEPAVSGVYDPGDGQQTRLDKVIGTVQTAADTAIGNINQTVDDAMESIGKAEESINESVTAARGSAEAAANSAQQATASASAAQTSERNAANSATQASQSATLAKQSETNAAESERNAAESERNAASSAEQAANIVASVSGSVNQAEDAARSASQSATAAAGSANAAGVSAQDASQSAQAASASASAAKTSETNATSSASAAKTSETNAAASAESAQRSAQETYKIANRDLNVETRLNAHDIVAQTYDATATAPVAYSPTNGPTTATDLWNGYAYVFRWNGNGLKEHDRQFITWIEFYLSSNGGGSFSIGWADDDFPTAEAALTVNVSDSAEPTLTRVNLPQYPGHGRLFIRPETGNVKVSSSNSGNSVFSNIIDATNGSSGSTKKVWSRVGLTIKPDFTTASSLTFNRYVNELVLNRVMSINSNDVLTDDTIDKGDGLHAQRWWTFKPSALEGHTTISFYLTADVSGDFLMGFTSISNPSWDDLVTYHYPSKAGWYTFPMPVANPTYSDPVFLVKAVRSNRFPLACHSRSVTADDEIYDITGAFGSTDSLAYAPSMKPNAGEGTYGVPYVRIGDFQSIVPVTKSNMKNTLTWPNVIWDATSLIGMKLSGLWMDYMYDGRSDVLEFSNVNGQSDVWTPDVPESDNGIKCTPITLDIHDHNGEQAWHPLSFNYVSVRNEVRPQPIRILIIGDSVTSGAITSEPYWSVAARCFMRDDAAHDRYSSESARSDVLFLGTYRDGENSVLEVNDTFNGQALSTRVAVCANSGSSLNNWLRNTRSGIDYGFYDGSKFSINRWLGLYRNYHDDGTPMSCGDEGLGSLITEENINQKICATPNVVMIVHGHNGGSTSEFETIIDEIRSEYPNMPIIVGAAMPLLGSWNKQLYRDRYDIGSPVISRGPQYTWGSNNGTGRVQAAMNWINVEAGKNSSNGKRYENVWFFPMCVTTPTVEAVKTRGTISNGVREVKTFQPNGLPIEHPNYNAHFNWGVDLYGLLSWMFRDPSNPTNISDKNPIIPVRP